MISRLLPALLVCVALFIMVPQISLSQTTDSISDERAATGGAQTLEDILARQRGEEIDDSFRSTATGNPEAATGTTNQLGTLGGVSDADIYRDLRYGTADVTLSNRDPTADIMIQDSGMSWLKFRAGPWQPMAVIC